MDLDEEEYKATRKLNGLDKDIQVGEYGRTSKGKIFIFVWVENAEYILVKTRNDEHKNSILNFDKYWLDKDEQIAKHSQNIIDLIEVGDYVNKYLVIAKSDDGYLEIAVGDDIEQGELLEESDIESIVTHEQFNSVMYKVKE